MVFAGAFDVSDIFEGKELGIPWPPAWVLRRSLMFQRRVQQRTVESRNSSKEIVEKRENALIDHIVEEVFLLGATGTATLAAP